MEKKENWKGRRKMKIGRGKGMKISRGLLFFFFFFCFSLCDTSKICLGSTKMEISTGKKSILRQENRWKVTLPPLKNIPLTPLQQKDTIQHHTCRFKSDQQHRQTTSSHGQPHNVMTSSTTRPKTAIMAHFKQILLPPNLGFKGHSNGIGVSALLE